VTPAVGAAQSGLLPAVLDTSYWVIACRADIAANCLDLFEMIAPAEVQREIETKDPLYPTGEFPYATLFRHLRDRMRDPPNPEPAPVKALHAGEAAALALAQDLGVPLLVNEVKARNFATNLGVPVITVPATIVWLYSRGVISSSAAWRKLQLIERNTADAILREAAVVLAALGA
jgi:hypothetical protein